MRLVFTLVASLAIGGCAALAGAGLGGAGGSSLLGHLAQLLAQAPARLAALSARR